MRKPEQVVGTFVEHGFADPLLLLAIRNRDAEIANELERCLNTVLPNLAVARCKALIHELRGEK